MNAKTAKLLRRFAAESGRDYHGLKELWMNTPSAFRVEMRQSIQTDLANGNQTTNRPSPNSPAPRGGF